MLEVMPRRQKTCKGSLSPNGPSFQFRSELSVFGSRLVHICTPGITSARVRSVREMARKFATVFVHCAAVAPKKLAWALDPVHAQSQRPARARGLARERRCECNGATFRLRYIASASCAGPVFADRGNGAPGHADYVQNPALRICAGNITERGSVHRCTRNGVPWPSSSTRRRCDWACTDERPCSFWRATGCAVHENRCEFSGPSLGLIAHVQCTYRGCKCCALTVIQRRHNQIETEMMGRLETEILWHVFCLRGHDFLANPLNQPPRPPSSPTGRS